MAMTGSSTIATLLSPPRHAPRPARIASDSPSSPPPPSHAPCQCLPQRRVPVPVSRAGAMAIDPASPTGRTLSAALAEDRRRETRRRLAIPGLLPDLRLRLHCWSPACLPKSRAALARDLDAARRARSAPPVPRTPGRQVAAREDAAAVSVAERRPLREREDQAAVDQATPAESQARIITATKVAGGDQSIGSGEQPATASTVGRGASIWVRVSRKPSLQVESPLMTAESPTAEDKYVWADKYQPDVLKDFICNKDVADELHQLVTEHKCNHFIFEGPQAVGKRSMVLALMRDAFGPDDLKIHECTKRIELKGEIAKHIDVRVKISVHHVEVDLADLHGYEKYVITTFLNESIPSPNSTCDHTNCRVIVVHDADRLSPDLQHYIGWFLGRYAGCNKIIFCCSDSSNLEAVKHLCKVVTLQPPSFDEIIKVLEFIAKQENIDLPHAIAWRIAASASNNLRQAIRSFEATCKANYPFIEDQAILTGWEEEISNTAKKILEEPSPKQLYVIRGKIRKLIEYNVSPYFIFCHLVTELKRGKDEEMQNKIDELASELNCCTDRMFQKERCKEFNSRDTTLDMRDINIEGFAMEGHDQGEAIQCFIKIEEFTVRFMSFYRSLVAKNSSKGSVL